MKAKLVRESLDEQRIDEKWFKGDGPLITAAINFLMSTAGVAATSFLYKHTGDIAWGIMAPILFGVGGFGLLGAAFDLDYFEWIDDLENWVKSRKYATEKGKGNVEETIQEIKNIVKNNPEIPRGKKAHITRIQNEIKTAIEQKDWVYVKNLLKELQTAVGDYKYGPQNK